ncbi:MAG: hypothetical protein ACTTH9_02980, partial [Porphyromonas gingivalis]
LYNELTNKIYANRRAKVSIKYLNMLQPKELIGRRNGRSWSIHVFNVFVGVLLFVHNSLYLWFVTMK